MAESTMGTQGAVSWVELNTTDPKAAGTFYKALFGWQLEADAMGHAGYTVVKVDGKGVAGIMGMPPGCPAHVGPHWNVYVTVKDIDATAAKAAKLGGKVLAGPMDIERVGRFAVIQDPQGAVICAIQFAPQGT